MISIKRAIVKQGFCGRLYYIDFKLTWILVALCLIIVVFSGKLGVSDLSPLTVMIEMSFGQLGVFTGFFVWKAKAENCRKFKDVNTESEE
jgi:hypothetical protein